MAIAANCQENRLIYKLPNNRTAIYDGVRGVPLAQGS